MKRQAGSTTTGRGRPRSAPTRRAILAAAAELLTERGPRGISVDAIAARAGASKATVYRWWPSKEALLFEAYQATLEAAVASTPTGPFTDALLAAVRARLSYFATHPEAARTMAALLAAIHEDPGFAAAYASHVVEPLRTVGREILGGAVARGEVVPDTDVEAALDLIVGPINHRILERHAPADERFAQTLVAFVARAVGAARPDAPWAGAPAQVRAGEMPTDRHRHVVVFYDDLALALRSLAPMIEEGLAQGEKAIHLVNPAARADYVRDLEAVGVGVADAARRGRLELRGWDESYLRSGHFDGDAMLALIEGMLTAASAEGFPRTRLAAHMEWALDGRAGSEDLMTYESRLNEVLPRYRDVVFCLYDSTKFGGDLLLDALRTHPLILRDGHLHANPVYVPPDRFVPRPSAAPPPADA